MAEKSFNMMVKMMDPKIHVIDYYIINGAIPSIITIFFCICNAYKNCYHVHVFPKLSSL